MSRPRIDDELLALYALDALEDDERALVEAAVAASPRLARRLDEHRRVATSLAEHVAIPPPTDLKARVLAAAFAEQPPREVAEVEAPSVVVPMRAPRSRKVQRFTFVVAGLAAAALALAVVRVATDSDGSGRSSFALVGEGSGRLVAVVDDDRIELTGAGVATVDTDRTYQLWVIGDDAQVRSAGLFTPTAEGAVDVSFDADLGDAATLAITVEPAGGLPAPTGSIAYSGTIDS